MCTLYTQMGTGLSRWMVAQIFIYLFILLFFLQIYI